MTDVLIGIPTLNGPDRLWRCLSSIREYTDLSGRVKLLVSDDCSDSNHLESNKAVVHAFGVDMLMSERRLGISAHWNRLVRHVSDAVIITLLNDDMEVAPDWLEVLEFSLKYNPEAGMIGLRSETGVTRTNSVRRPFIDYNESHLLNGSGALLASGGVCFAFRRHDWEAIGGFDERFFCFYEEIDFGISLVRKLSRFNYIADYPIVYHMGGATIGANYKSSDLIEDSKNKFVEKWKCKLDDFRHEFMSRTNPITKNWNSQWKYWKTP